MGQALRDGYRQKAFLMTKFDGRTKKATAQQIDESLARLQTDHIDLIQYHENIRMEDPDRFFAPDGPLEALMDAKQAGKIRYIGFTGHKDPLVHLRMLEVASANKFHFDSCQMPLNVLDEHFRSFYASGGAEASGAGHRRSRDEAVGERLCSAIRHERHRCRMPAICAQSSDIGSDNGLRDHGTVGAGHSRRRNVQAHEPRTNGSAAGEDANCRADGEI
jgi:hypothetical protein